MANTVTLSQSAYNELLNRLSRVEKMLGTVLEKLEKEPANGTSEWWEWSDTKALKDIKKGEYVAFDSAKDMVGYLKKR